MTRRDVYEKCMRFVSKMEGTASELDLAKEMGYEIEEDDLARAVIHRLRQAIKHVKKHPLEDDKARLLYHVVLYAEAIGKSEVGIPLCYIVRNDPQTRDEYRDMATEWLENAERALPDETYNKQMERAKILDMDAALEDANEWLKVQRKHATQPATKHVFNADLIKKSPDNAET